ncbi:hypothetical protein DYBT9275_05490 [Dyadobacter sp. CECT 9275]|uniref:Signal transduction histidine kinase internal region domain-containing protein n=1 Tax=Dyadobacter helix TaxID=2822344 RepID=A0A916JHK1_9BACT|nr:histidine kinase [Dyadobacter sp. CECT 9275]CAG5016169.1 hypothetical protein DYBT9275_05490 [Dyadobacter sp. CECT 9275]
MKKQNLIPGLIVSLGVALIASLPRVIRMEHFEFRLAGVSVAYNFTFCLCCWMAHQLILARSRRWKVNQVLLAILAIGGVSGIAFLLDPIFSAISPNALLLPEIAESKRPYILLLRSVVISGLFYFIAYYLHILAEKQRHLLEIGELKRAQLAANLSSLKEQLSPHFLFNTLNTLSTLTDEQLVKDYVSELANVYRYVLQYKDSDTATLQQELNFIDSYLYIIKMRLEAAIDIHIAVDPRFLSAKIPPLTLQLLVENAVRHNVASAARRLRIDIRTDGQGFLEVVNNLQPKTSVQPGAGIGLDNVMQRYRLLFNREIRIEKGTDTFTIKLPLA